MKYVGIYFVKEDVNPVVYLTAMSGVESTLYSINVKYKILCKTQHQFHTAYKR